MNNDDIHPHDAFLMRYIEYKKTKKSIRKTFFIWGAGSWNQLTSYYSYKKIYKENPRNPLNTWFNGISIDFSLPFKSPVWVDNMDEKEKEDYFESFDGSLGYNKPYSNYYAYVEMTFKGKHVKYGSKLQIKNREDLIPTCWKAFCRTVAKRDKTS